MPKLNELSGQRFGRLLVISRAPNQYKRKKASWNVICDCGKQKIVLGTSLTLGRTLSCGCLQKEESSKANKQFDSNPALRKLIASYQHAAQRRGLDFPFSLDEADVLFQQNCFYCGRPPHRVFTEDHGKYKYTYNGVDRIDSSKGYTFDNIRTCCKDCNYGKNAMTTEEFAEWIRKVYENFAKHNP